MFKFNAIIWSCAVAFFVPTYVNTTPAETPNMTSLSEEKTGFFINIKANVIDLYWQPIPRSHEYGEGFEYKICEKSFAECKYAKYSTIRFKYNKTKSYKFEIKGKNNEGESDSSTYINVAPFPNLFHEPVKLYKISKSNVHTVFWGPPKTDVAVHNYTVFVWGANNKHGQCDNEKKLKVSYVNSSTTSYSLTLECNVNFAVSANSLISRSGMVWAICSPGESIDKLTKNDILLVQAKKTQATFSWTPSCPDNLIVESYNLKVCFVSESLNCQHNSTSLKEFTITDLLPYTDYQIEIAMFFNGTIGEYSEPVSFKTAQAAPTSPQYITATNITNTSMTLVWQKPKHPNGFIKRYEIYIDKVIWANYTGMDAATNAFKIDNLKSFTTYQMDILACTVECSAKNETLTVTTDVSAPGLPREQNTTQKDNKVTLTWKEPLHIGGCLHHYILKIIVNSNNIENGTENTYLVYSSACEMTSLICQNYDKNYYQYLVRAVNSAKKPLSVCETLPRQLVKCESIRFDNESTDYLYGDWIDFKSFYCPSKGPPWYAIAFTIISGIVVIAGFSLSIYLVVGYCNKGRRLKIALPKQMEEVFNVGQFEDVLA